jgi:hypothetical protein
VLPQMVCENASIGHTLALSIQELLNQDETDNDPFKPRPISKGNFWLSHRGDIQGIDGPIDPSHLGLKPENPGDNFLLHRVGVSNASGTVRCYVAIFFYLEERTKESIHSPEFERKLPGFDRLPPSSPAPDGSKRRRGGTTGGFSFTNLFTWVA